MKHQSGYYDDGEGHVFHAHIHNMSDEGLNALQKLVQHVHSRLDAGLPVTGGDVDTTPICWACGKPMTWTGDEKEVQLEGGLVTEYEPIYRCANPDCRDDDEAGL